MCRNRDLEGLPESRGSGNPPELPRPAAEAQSSGLVGAGGVFKTILVDPPWKYEVPMKRKDSRTGRVERPGETMHPPYQMMEVDEIAALPIGKLADDNCHLWLWATNKYLPDSLELCKAWGFRFFHLVTWVKPSGIGMWFVHRTQPLIFAYRGKLNMQRKCNPNVIITGNPERHSAKPQESYELIEAVSQSPRIEIFARPWTPLFERRDGWDVWGNQVTHSVELRAGGGGAEPVSERVDTQPDFPNERQDEPLT